MNITEHIPFLGGSDAYDSLVDGLSGVKGDSDALALLPYDDGTFFLKPASFDKDLIGGQGGYETDDGDKIVMDGDGQPVRDLFGVPMLLAVDPTEHAAAVDPIKALVAQKDNIGEWLRVDSKGQVVQAGPAVDPAPIITNGETVDEVFSTLSDDELLAIHIDDYDPKEHSRKQKLELVTENEDPIKEKLADRMEAEQPVDVTEGGIVGDGGMAGDLVRQSRNTPDQPTVTFDEALKQLADQDKLTKVYDIAPPAKPYTNGDGDVKLEEATHIAVDQSKAAGLLPKTTSTTELNTALDKARMEEHDEGRVKSLITYGLIIGFVTALVAALMMAGLFALL